MLSYLSGLEIVIANCKDQTYMYNNTSNIKSMYNGVQGAAHDVNL